MCEATTISDFFLLLNEAENFLHHCFVDPKFIPSMIDRCQKALEATQFFDLKSNDDFGQRVMSAVKTMGFLISDLQKRYQKWKNYTLTRKEIKCRFANSKSIFYDLRNKEKRDTQEVRRKIKMLKENNGLSEIHHNLIILQKLEEVFGNDIPCRRSWFYHAKLQRLKEQFQCIAVKYECELDEVETFEKSATGLKQELHHVKELIDLFHHEESTVLKRFIENALRTLSAKIDHIRGKIMGSESRRHYVSTDHITIDDLDSKFSICKSRFEETCSHHEQVKETISTLQFTEKLKPEKINQEKIILEAFSEMKPEDACKLIAKLHELYGPTIVELEEDEKNNLSNADQAPKVNKLMESAVEKKLVSEEFRKRDQSSLDEEALNEIGSKSESADTSKLAVVSNENTAFEEEKPIGLQAPPPPETLVKSSSYDDFSEDEIEKNFQQKLREQKKNRMFEEELSAKKKQREKINRAAQDEIRAMKESQIEMLKGFSPK